MTALGYVYFIRPVGMPGPVKIGFADFPLRRLHGLAAWSPFPLEVIATVDGSFALEQTIHSIMHASHSHKEWFHPTAEILAMVEALEAGQTIEEAVDFSRPRKSIHPTRKGTRSPLSRLHMSLRMRFLHALKKVGDRRYSGPPEAEHLLDRIRYGHPPTSDELAYLEDIIGNIEAYAASKAKQPSLSDPAERAA